MSEITAKAPWKSSLGDLPFTMEYDQKSVYRAVKEAADKFSDQIAYDFLGRSTTYKKMIENIKKCAIAFKMMGIREGDIITIALPNCPQAIVAFYAASYIGAVSSIIHPLSAEKEFEKYLMESRSRTIIVLGAVYSKVEAIRHNTDVSNVVIVDIKDELTRTKKVGYRFTEGRKNPKLEKDTPVIFWKEFMDIAKKKQPPLEIEGFKDDTAVILYSGGTTGKSKGIELTNLNVNALGRQIIATNPMFRPKDRMLAAMPIFHGFGLGVCIHSMLISGGRCVLVPRFTAESYAKLITKYKCNFIAGVPTLYEALLHVKSLNGKTLNSLKGVYSGGDSLSPELKKKIDKFLYDHDSPVQVREGYGTTETVNACCLTPPSKFKEGSIGLPFPDTYFKIVKPGTDEELPYGEMGEILIAGPTTMKGYLHETEETKNTIRHHDDGLDWVYTGDLGVMDTEGFVYFKGRIKRVIVASGYNVYPSELERIFEEHPKVHLCCVIGVPDPYRMHKVKAFVVLENDCIPNEETKEKLMIYCSKNIAKYAMPYDIEFREELPKTLVGKVDYRKLEEEELKDQKQYN